MKKERSLMSKSLTQFIVCVAVLLLLATPLFYWLTKNFYAEDMIDIMEAARHGAPMPATDLEEDILHGVMLQFALIATVLGIALVLTMRFISARLWRPFDRTLQALEQFRLEDNRCPALGGSDIREFARLNTTLTRLMTNSLHSYRMQKEFTENASHELQTPLAVFQSKLDLLLQQPGITQQQAAIIQDLYTMNSRLSRLNRNLLLLAKMENSQFSRSDTVDIATVITDLLPYLESLSSGLIITRRFSADACPQQANRPLVESLVTNLVVNAVRHNRPGGDIVIALSLHDLVISNTSDEPPLDPTLIFNRFYRPSGSTAGNGLGLAIVRAVCRYHGWEIAYSYTGRRHVFTVTFG